MSNYQQESREGSVGAEKPVTYTIDSRRRTALQEIDDAPFSWFHAKVCLVAGVGFFTDVYETFAINIASTMLGYIYGTGSPPNKAGQKLNKNQDLGVKVATPIGTLVGQLLLLPLGWLADVVGRKRMYGIELMIIIIIATFAQALCWYHRCSYCLALFDGDHPLSAVISSEFAATRIRGRMMTAAFSSRGWGNFAAALVALIVVAAYKNSILNDPSIDNPAHVDEWVSLVDSKKGKS